MDVACLLVPDFLVALARRDRPDLRGRPVVIGGSPDEHASVAACSHEAAAAGVEIGTTLRRALALCPEAVFLPLQQGQAASEAAAILDRIHLYSPLVEAIEPGHIHFEVRGLPQLARMDEEAWLADLHSAVSASAGVHVRLAAAPTVFAAHAANYRASPSAVEGVPVLVRPAETRAFLGRLPVEVLPVPPVMHQRLRLFGLDFLGQVAGLPFSAMQAQFGRDGARAWHLARGRDDSLIVPAAEEVRLVEEVDLPGPVALSEPLVAGTRGLLQKALERAEVRGRSLRRADWRVGLESGEQITRRAIFREPTADAVRILFVLRGKIERLQLPSAAISLGITLSGLCSEYGHQANLWQVGPRRWKELAESVEQLHARTGGPQVFRIVEVQPWSRIPERQLGLVAFGG
jgi:nucleotidyltransferase/DNA polymerase involved in DNA repair